MKKVLSVFLAAIIMISCVAPAFAADSVNVTFVAPSSQLEVDDDGTPAYTFVKSDNGNVEFKEDDNGAYVYYEKYSTYILPENIVNNDDREAAESWQRYSLVPIESGSFENGTVICFQVITNKIYNQASVAVFVNGEEIQANTNDEYTVIADSDLTVKVAEFNDNNEQVLLKNHYTVSWSMGDGYRIRTLENENYKVVYYGGDFYFRVKTLSGYSSSGMTVSVLRNADQYDTLEEMGSALAAIGKTEQLTSYKQDGDGYRYYKISNITSNCKVYVNGVREEKSASILATLKRILRMILNIFGLGDKIPSLNDKIADHTVEVDTTAAAGITYSVTCAGANNVSSGKFLVLDGDTATIVVKAPEKNGATVMWTPGNETGTSYEVEWIAAYDYLNGETYYEAVYNVENITADTVITIVAN